MYKPCTNRLLEWRTNTGQQLFMSPTARLAHIRSARTSIFHLPTCVGLSRQSHRRAMISALRSSENTHPPPLADSPPIVIPPTSSLFPNASSPQVAAGPPPAPKTEKSRPKLRAAKSALTIVCTAYPISRLDLTIYLSVIDPRCCAETQGTTERAYSNAYPYRCAE